ncbi:MAG: hypothetical protein KF789_05150 [Bdellovibrionaceae bacterium]|nr:hypothetical protein [Pseudobdellovibrionaceae bacterium]
MELRTGFVDHLKQHYPALSAILDERPELISENLLSPFHVTLPRSILPQIEAAVQSVQELRHRLSSEHNAQSGHDFPNPGNQSTMMSLDFHLDEKDQLKLIEINTNAAFLIMGWEMYRFRGLQNPVQSFTPERWKADLAEELKSNRDHFGKGPAPESPLVAISDDEPEQQRLFIEFLVAQEWIRSWGWQADIRDFKNVTSDPRPDVVYNRSTDFYLAQPQSSKARESFMSGETCFSPNPFEYSLLADKERMIEWSRPGFLESLGLSPESLQVLKDIVPVCVDLSRDTADELWARRKQLFFKAKREFGSKKAFRGASISRKVFDEMTGEDMLAQEFIPPREIEFPSPEGPIKLKYDLRCHFYQGRLEGVLARLYQGQVTNLKTPYGGFTPVVFE